MVPTAILEMEKETCGIQSQMVIIIIIIMHLSMLCPRVVGGADPGYSNIFTRARVKFPTPNSVLLIRQ